MSVARRRAGAPAPVLDDGEVMSRVALGDLAALGTLYDRYAPHLLRFVRRVSRDQDAADIVHTTFLRVVALAGTYDPSARSARPWLFAILVRVMQEHRRSVRRWASALVGLATQSPLPPATIPEARSDLDRCLSRLPPAKRTALLLAEVEGFTCEEIAKMVSVPVGTVWTRLHHARRQLRECYEGDD